MGSVLAEVFLVVKSGRGLPAAHCPAACPGIRDRGRPPPAGLTGTPPVPGPPREGRLLPGAATGRVVVPGLVSGTVSISCAGCGWGPRTDLPVAAKHPARHPGVSIRILQAPHHIGADADHVVAVPDRIPSGLDPNGGVGYQNCPNARTADGGRYSVRCDGFALRQADIPGGRWNLPTGRSGRGLVSHRKA
jgi:hypothetical protein